MKRKIKGCISILTALSVVVGFPAFADAMANAAYGDQGMAKSAYSEKEAALLTFSDEAVTEKGLEGGYTIEGTSVTVSAAGTYVFSGSCADGSITVKKGTTGVKLVLDGLDLTSASADGGPILCKASTETEIVAEAGTVNNLADSAVNAEEKAAIKVNKQSSLVLSGTGTLNVNGVYKNGIKGGAETDIIVKEQDLYIKASDNGLASDNSVTVKSGKITIDAGGDGIKSSPDRVDDAGNADDTVSLGNVVLEGGEINITALADGIQGDNSVEIQGGSYQITANGGYTTTLADDADSCKGIKTDSVLTINGGEFTINSADDALHSNEYISVLGGTFDIRTGDDGMHADTSLIVGSEEGESKPDITIRNCYEGLEAGTVYVNGGSININSTDDGVNAAGGKDGSGSNGGPGDGFNPWGGGHGGRPGGGGRSAESSEYAIYINGGTLFVKAGGDGLDSNGDIYIAGGNIIVYGAAAGGPGSDNFPFDHDRTFAITGGYIFGAGSSQMEEGIQSSTQGYIVDRSAHNQGTVINVTDSQGTVLFTETLAERVNYMMYSSPEMAASGDYSFKTGTVAGLVDIGSCKIALAEDSYVYSGTEKKPDVTVTYNGKTLSRNVDYTVIYSNNTEPGTAKVTIKGMGSYTGSVDKEFEILEQGDITDPGEETVDKPSRVKGIQAVSVNTSKIKISWKEASGADGYYVYRYDSVKKAWKCLKDLPLGSSCGYTDHRLASGTAYKYRVCAYVNSKDNKILGDVSQSVAAATKPEKCCIKSAAAKKRSITLKWKKTAGSGYEITYSLSKDFSNARTIRVKGASKESYSIKKLKAKKTYYVKIRAYKEVKGKVCRGAYSAKRAIKVK